MRSSRIIRHLSRRTVDSRRKQRTRAGSKEREQQLEELEIFVVDGLHMSVFNVTISNVTYFVKIKKSRILHFFHPEIPGIF